MLFEVGGVLVPNDSHRLAGVRPADDRPVLSRREQGLLVPADCSGLGRGDKPSADPNAVGTEGEGSRKPPAIEDATRRYYRDLVPDRVDDLGDERHRGHLPGVAACLGPLRHDEVAAGSDRLAGVVDLAAHAHHQDAGIMA